METGFPFSCRRKPYRGLKKEAGKTGEYEDAFCRMKGISVVYEDDHILVMNKPREFSPRKQKQAICL